MSALEELYRQTILDHARAPHGRGLGRPRSHPGAGQSHQVNPTCGDEVTLRVVLSDAADPIVEEVRWEGQGCSISQASISVMTELVTGRPVSEAEHLSELFRQLMDTRGQGLDDALSDELEDAAAFAGVSKFPARIKCALLGWAALRESVLLARATLGDRNE